MSIRIIFTGEETNNNICSGSFTNAPYVGNYAHWSGSNIYANSYTKVKIDEWYESNLDSYTYLLADNAFCNDVTYVENGGVFTYGANSMSPSRSNGLYRVQWNNLNVSAGFQATGSDFYPVISLNKDITILPNGDGTKDNPYIVVEE